MGRGLAVALDEVLVAEEGVAGMAPGEGVPRIICAPDFEVKRQ